MAGHGENDCQLTPEQDEAAVALASGLTISALSATTLVSERTIYRWLKLPAFKGRMDEIRAGMISSASGKLQAEMDATLDVLMDLRNSEYERTRLAAVRAHMDMMLKLRAFEDYDRRLCEVEERLGIAQPRGDYNP